MAMFSKRHYEALARLIRQQIEHSQYYCGDPDSAFNEGARWASKVIGQNMGILFEADNPRFDAERFNKACVPGGKQ